MTTALEGKSILIVDDDPDMITALQAVLNDTGATIETAVDGNAAVEAATDFDPDLVVLDAMLPKRSGFLVLEKLKGAAKKAGLSMRELILLALEEKGYLPPPEILGPEEMEIATLRAQLAALEARKDAA